MADTTPAIYTITVMDPDKQRYRTWGFYFDYQKARAAVLANATDMFEAGYYKLAVVEAIEEGLIPICNTRYWFAAKYQKNGSAIVRAIPAPKRFERIVNFAMG